jgi:hypothetical protein
MSIAEATEQCTHIVPKASLAETTLLLKDLSSLVDLRCTNNKTAAHFSIALLLLLGQSPGFD